MPTDVARYRTRVESTQHIPTGIETYSKKKYATARHDEMLSRKQWQADLCAAPAQPLPARDINKHKFRKGRSQCELSILIAIPLLPPSPANPRTIETETSACGTPLFEGTKQTYNVQSSSPTSSQHHHRHQSSYLYQATT
jgi:hypothetical protein